MSCNWLRRFFSTKLGVKLTRINTEKLFVLSMSSKYKIEVIDFLTETIITISKLR